MWVAVYPCSLSTALWFQFSICFQRGKNIAFLQHFQLQTLNILSGRMQTVLFSCLNFRNEFFSVLLVPVFNCFVVTENEKQIEFCSNRIVSSLASTKRGKKKSKTMNICQNFMCRRNEEWVPEALNIHQLILPWVFHFKTVS